MLSTIWNWLAHTLDWGNVRELVTWVVAGVALVFARNAARAARLTNVQQQKQIEALEKEKHQYQADRVAAWIQSNIEGGAKYRVSNQSGQPIYNFTVWHTDQLERGYPMQAWVVPPGEYFMDLYVPWVPPQEPIEFNSYFQTPITYLFTDGLQQNWLRTYSGSLDPVDAPEYSTHTKPGSITPIDYYEQRRSQARDIAVWATTVDGKSAYRISNMSGQPVYEMRVWHQPNMQGMFAVASVPPGEHYILASDESDNGPTLEVIMGIRVEYTFRDMAQLRWHRKKRGELQELSGPPTQGDPSWTYLYRAES